MTSVLPAAVADVSMVVGRRGLMYLIAPVATAVLAEATAVTLVEEVVHESDGPRVGMTVASQRVPALVAPLR